MVERQVDPIDDGQKLWSDKLEAFESHGVSLDEWVSCEINRAAIRRPFEPIKDVLDARGRRL